MGLWTSLARAWRGEPVPEIDARALALALDGPTPPVVLDVRSTGEFRHSHVPGATLVPLPSLAARLPRLELPKEAPIVAVCLSGHRSVPAVRHLRARGHVNAVQLRGGMAAWWRAGLPTRTGLEG